LSDLDFESSSGDESSDSAGGACSDFSDCEVSSSDLVLAPFEVGLDVSSSAGELAGCDPDSSLADGSSDSLDRGAFSSEAGCSSKTGSDVLSPGEGLSDSDFESSSGDESSDSLGGESSGSSDCPTVEPPHQEPNFHLKAVQMRYFPGDRPVPVIGSHQHPAPMNRFPFGFGLSRCWWRFVLSRCWWRFVLSRCWWRFVLSRC